MSNVVFHIGYPKTGTTTLQFAFMKSPKVHYLGKNLRDGASPADPRVSLSKDIANAILSADSVRFTSMLPGLQRAIEQLLSDGRSLLISDEAFAFGEYTKLAIRSPTTIFTDHVVIADRLRRLWPGATVVASIREQRAFLASFYLQRLSTGMKFVTLSEYVERAFATTGHRSMLNALRFDEMLDAYTQAFGVDRIKLMAFESYRARFQGLVASVADAMGLSAEDAQSLWQGGHSNGRKDYAHARWAHGLLSSTGLRLPGALYQRLHHVFTLVPDKVEFPPQLEDQARAFFAHSNQRLAEMTGLDLASLGYATEAPRPA